MTPSLTRDRGTWLAYALLAVYGYCLNGLGPITPFLKDELGLSYTVASLHFTAFAAGILAVGLGGHAVIARLGRERAQWLGAAGLGAGVVLLAAGRTPLLTIPAAFFMSLVGSLILAIVPASLSDRHGARRAQALSEANLLASAASTAVPLLVGWSARTLGDWRPALALAALAALGLYAAFGRTSAAPAAQPAADPAAGRAGLPLAYWLYWGALMLAVSVEFCLVFWSADFVAETLGWANAAAAQSVSVFLAAMIVGRGLGSRLVQRWPAAAVVTASLVIAGLGFGFFWQGRAPGLLLGGLFVAGLGVASLYPVILALSLGAAGPHSDAASARATLASGTAILALPLLLGRLADGVGLGPAYGVVPALLAGALLLVGLAGRQTRKEPA